MISYLHLYCAFHQVDDPLHNRQSEPRTTLQNTKHSRKQCEIDHCEPTLTYRIPVQSTICPVNMRQTSLESHLFTSYSPESVIKEGICGLNAPAGIPMPVSSTVTSSRTS